MVGYEPDLNVKFDSVKVFAIRDPEKINATLLTSSYHKRIFTDRDYTHDLATPVVQVFGVEIVTNFGDGKPCEVYGSIEAFEGTRYCFDLYRRGREDYEEIEKGRGPLSLICPSDVPIFPTMTGTLNFSLKDNIRGVKLVDGKLCFYPSNDDSYDRLLTYDLRGPHGLARVYYVVFRFAHLFTVHIEVTKTDNDDKNGIGHDIFGSIVASYPNDSMKPSDYQPLKRLEAKLFNRPSDKPLRLMAGTPIILSRNVVAAPVYSSLDLKVDVWDSDKKVTRARLQFPANNFDEQNLQHIQTEYASVAVQIELACAYELSMVLLDQRLSVACGPSTVPEPMTSCAVEVFSVFVGGIAKQITSLCGVILIDDGADQSSIYNRDDKDREILLTSQLASIEVNYRAILNMEFRIHLYLKDPDANLEVSRGTVSWNIGQLEDDPNLSFYSKRICSVVRGDDGYAAVHYSIFSRAYEASVQFELKLTTPDYPNAPLLLYGTVFGRYGGYEYTTSYDKKYYQSRLFDRAKGQPVRVQFDEKVTMLKSLVVVPRGSCLIIDADLRIVNGEEFKGLAEFHSNVLPQSMTLQGTHYDIKVSVEFRN